MGVQIHPTAIVDDKAQLGEEVEVGAYSIIGADVVIGDRCKIASHVVLEGRTTLGKECEIFSFACIGGAPQDLKYHGEPSTLVVGDQNIMREYVTLQPGTESGNMTTVIGNANLFMASSHVGHDCVIGDRNIFANSCGLAGHVTVQNHVTLGGLVGIHQFARIGDGAFLSAGSMVGLDVPPFCFAQGDRCRLRGVNTVGLQRRGCSESDVREVKKAYRKLFSQPGSLEDKLAELPKELAERPLVAQMIQFAKESERGITSA